MGTKALAILDLASGILNDEGDPISGGLVYFYEAGTLTLKDVYLDRNKVTPAANPVVLDIYGRAEVYGDGLYKMIIQNSDSVVLWDVDDVEIVPLEGGTYDGVTINPATSAPVTGSALEFTVSLEDPNGDIISEFADLQPYLNFESVYEVDADLSSTVVSKDPIYWDNSNSVWEQADPTTNTPVAFCVSAVDDGDGTYSGKIVFSGVADGLTALNSGSKYYIGASGGITTAITDWYIGVAVSSSKMLINIGALGGGGAGGYEAFIKYPYAPSGTLAQFIVTSGQTVSEISAYLECGAGVQDNDCSATTNWTEVDGANLAVETTDFKEGGACLTFDKSGSNVLGYIENSSITTFDGTSSTVFVWVKLPSITDVVNIQVRAGQDNTHYFYKENTVQTNGDAFIAGWNLVQVQPGVDSNFGSATATGIGYLAVGVATTNSTDTLTGVLVDHFMHGPDTDTLDVNLYVNGLLLKQAADTYSFGAIYPGTTILNSTSLENTALEIGDVISVKIINTSTYPGQGLTVGVK